jgi:Flp pilus assembly protein TadD
VPQLPSDSRADFVTARTPRTRSRFVHRATAGHLKSERSPIASPMQLELRRRHALGLARQALRRGELEEAERQIYRARSAGGDDAVLENVAGVLHECRGEVDEARACYGRAIALCAAYGPAQQNMRRLYELATFGRTSKAVQLGDEPGRG